jgi:hypothetical protein
MIHGEVWITLKMIFNFSMVQMYINKLDDGEENSRLR